MSDREPLGISIRCPKCGGQEWGSAAIDGDPDGHRTRMCYNRPCSHVWDPREEEDGLILYSKLLGVRDRIIENFLEFASKNGWGLHGKTLPHGEVVEIGEEGPGELIGGFLAEDETDYSVTEEEANREMEGQVFASPDEEEDEG